MAGVGVTGLDEEVEHAAASITTSKPTPQLRYVLARRKAAGFLFLFFIVAESP
jgi:hypothetical protein